MKGFRKLALLLGFQCFAAVCFAGSMGALADPGFNVYVPNLKQGFEFSASALYLRPEAGNFGWSVVTTVLPIPTPEWHVQTIKPDFQAGIHLGGRYIFSNSGIDAQLNWFYLHSKDNDSVQVNPVTQWVSPFSQTGTPPTGGEITGIASLKSATAILKFNYNAANLDLGKFVNFGPKWQTRFFTGLSSAWISETLNSNFYGAPTAVLFFNNKSTYTGVGPRLGFNNLIDLYKGIQLSGQIAGAVLIGKMQPAEYKFTGMSSDLALVHILQNDEIVASSSVTQIVPAVDAKLGLIYNYLLANEKELSFELGYMGAVYINPLSSYETNTNVIALDSGSLSTSSVKHIQSNFSVAGAYFTARLLC